MNCGLRELPAGVRQYRGRCILALEQCIQNFISAGNLPSNRMGTGIIISGKKVGCIGVLPLSWESSDALRKVVTFM